MPLSCGVKQGAGKLAARLVWNASPQGKGDQRSTRGVPEAVSLKDDHFYHACCGGDVGARQQATEASERVGLLGCLGKNFSH